MKQSSRQLPIALLVALLGTCISACGDTSEPRSIGPLQHALQRASSVVGGQSAHTNNYNPNPISVFQTFNGTVLSESRAQAMADANGMELIRFYPCPEPSDSCAMFEVIGARGINTYLYQLSSESCWSPGPLSSSHTATLNLHPPAATTAARTRGGVPSRSAPVAAAATTSTVSTSNVHSLDVENEAACFAGYSVTFRAIIENSLYVEPGKQLFASEHRYQVYDQETWKDVGTLNQHAASWYDGCNLMSSRQVQILDANNVAVLDHSEIEPGGCASSAPYSGVPAEDCARVADSADGLLAGLSTVLDVACDASGFITLRPDEISVGYESDGVTVGGSKNLNICEVSKSGREAVAGLVEDALVLTGHETPWLQVYNSCLADPGWYLPSVYPAPSDPPPFCADALSELFTAEEESSIGGCPSSYVAPVTQDMGGGTVCDADVRFECVTTTSGACECDPVAVEGELICTSS